ncbi:sensor histidine kinase [Alistipes sp. ZOR0009]|uniref:sensor histidine kinase n=1 Tax=Alistipes sp. ZOR0009 TaxID=1339253 RepID=UPI0006484A0B|nr:ATP-binding protein [Alistipes sp. ZOR0009]
MKIKYSFWLIAGTFYLALAVVLIYGFLKNPRMLLLSQLLLILLFVGLIYFYRLIIRPINIIASGSDLIKEQDFSSRLTAIGQPDIDKLIGVFNKMMGQLKEERLRVREQHYFLDLLINASPLGVITLDFDQRISSLNPSAQRLFVGSETTGRLLAEIDHPLAAEMATLKPNEHKIVRLSGLHVYKCTRSYFIDRGFQHPFILVEELTHELIRTEKKAYEKVIRVMSHEVNNAIGATNSMLNLLADNLRQSDLAYSEDFCNVIDIATERGSNLSRLMSNFSEVVKIPDPARKEVSLQMLIDAVRLPLEAECHKRNIKFTIDLPTPAPTINADIIQMEQVLINIVKNSMESIGRDGQIVVKITSNPLALTVEDNGKGIAPEEQSLLFTPFFSTKPNGQGIGLMFIREILLNHQYQMSLETKANGITEFRIGFK